MQFDPVMIERLHRAQHVIVFTGAGVSQESGIPTFRDTMTGLWSNFNPEELATPEAFQKQPDLVWGWYEWRRKAVMTSVPNQAHMAIAAIENKVPKLTLVTQNVDNLHERAGSTGVIHLHGSLHQPRCTICSLAHLIPAAMPDVTSGGERIMPPSCIHCSGRIRPGVVWFGESLSDDTWGLAKEAVRSCDLMFSIGTSSLVYPAAVMPFEAVKRGACVIQVNPMPTDLDQVASYNLRGKAGEIMAALFNAAWGTHAT